MTTEEEVFLQQVLEQRDELYRETSRLKSQLSGYQNFESERTSYLQQLDESKQTISKLKQQIEMLQRRIGANPVNGTSTKTHCNESSILKD